MTDGSHGDLPAKEGASLGEHELLLQLGIALVVGAGLGYCASRVSPEPWHMMLAVVAVLLLAYAAFILVSLLAFTLISRRLDHLGEPRRERFLDRWPTLVRLLTPAFVAAWACMGVLYGYDTRQWLWTGVSLLAAVTATLLVTCRRRRTAVPDGPNGPRHRRVASD